MMNFLMPQKNTTFKPKRRVKGSEKACLLLDQRSTQTLGSNSLKDAVKLPAGECKNEWIAVNIVDFFNQINMLYGTLTELCRPDRCPIMSAGPKYEYYWADTSGSSKGKPLKCSAPQYIDLLMTWVQDQLDDENVFPSKLGVDFQPDFLEKTSKPIMKRLFRVYAHIYYEHFEDIEKLKEEPHLNTSFKHFILFVQEFGLIEKKELAPLTELIDRLANGGHNSQAQAENNGHPQH